MFRGGEGSHLRIGAGAGAAISFWAISGIGFVLAAMSFWGAAVPDGARSILDTSIAVTLNPIVLVALLLLRWPPTSMFGR